MKRADALPFVSYYLDNALSPREAKDMPDNAVLIGWQAGFEPLFVAVWSYLGSTSGPADALDPGEAEEIAADYLQELGWFSGYSDDGFPPDASFVIA